MEITFQASFSNQIFLAVGSLCWLSHFHHINITLFVLLQGLLWPVSSLHVFSCSSLAIDLHVCYLSSSWHIQWRTFLVLPPPVYRSSSERAVRLPHFIFKIVFCPKREVVAAIAFIDDMMFSCWSILSHCLLMFLQFLSSWTEKDSLMEQNPHILAQRRCNLWLDIES